MDKAWAQVYEFHEKFALPHEDSPRLMTAMRAAERIGYMREEIDEFAEAVTLDEQADAMIDLIYFALGTLVEMGVRPQALFDIVHNANMQKLFPDGRPHYNEAHKVIKPEGWQDPAPLLRAALDKQCLAQ